MPVVYLRAPVTGADGIRRPGGFWFMGYTTERIRVQDVWSRPPHILLNILNGVTGLRYPLALPVGYIAIKPGDNIRTVVIEKLADYEAFCLMAAMDDPTCPVKAL